MHRPVLALVAALAVALVVVSLSAAAHHGNRKTHHHRYPHRIVSLSPTVTEDLFAIGAGKQVVAVDQDSNFPKRAPHTSLSGYTPNVEAIANYRPDLVLISFNPGNVAAQLGKLGIEVESEAAANTLTQAYREIVRLGRLTGHARAAQAVVHRMQRQLRRIVRSVPPSHRHLRVYHELEADYYTATSKTFIGRIYKLFGFRDIADAADTTGSGYPQLSAEYILAKNPQIIVLADGQTPAELAARPGWKTIAAVRHHRVLTVNADVASRWGPRIVQFARAVARIAKQG